MADEKEKEGSGFAVDDLIEATSLDEDEMDFYDTAMLMRNI